MTGEPRFAKVNDPVWVLPLGRAGVIARITATRLIVDFRVGEMWAFPGDCCLLLDRPLIGAQLWLRAPFTTFQA